MINTGVYMLIDHGEIVYIGQSANIQQRINSHKKDKQFDDVRIIDCNKIDRRIVERDLIHKHSPKYNKCQHKSVPNLDGVTIRFNITDEENKKLMKLKGDRLKVPFAESLLREAIKREEARQKRKVK